MKFPDSISSRRRAAFTLPELMVSLTVFSLLLTGVVFAHLYGLSMFRVTENSLTTTAVAREVMGRMTDEIRTCSKAVIGDVKATSGTNVYMFVGLLNGETQHGGGLQIFPTANTNNYIVYYYKNQNFYRSTSTPGSAVIVAESVTNAVVFRAEDHLGQVLTNNLNNRVIHFNLEFYQPRRHMQVADYFKLESSVTRRAE